MAKLAPAAVDVMRSIGGGVIVAVDVTRYETLRPSPSPGGGSIWRLSSGNPLGSPSVVSTLLRSAHLGSDVQTRLSREAADLVLDPPLAEVDLRD